ncbi:MAG: hypothetical protein KDI72_01790 [Xanthomonadales bacterium]|nr:hypothetical protein [Xanthomonadales bacterium]
MDEISLSKLTPAALRLSHAEYFLDQYRAHMGPPIDSYWLMIGYFDAFLFALASVFDMSDRRLRGKFKGNQPLSFFVALRNITAHHSVLASSGLGSKFARPFSRAVGLSAGGPPNDSSRLFFRLDVLERILDAVLIEWPKAEKNVKAAKRHIEMLRRQPGRIYIEDQMQHALEAARQLCVGA